MIRFLVLSIFLLLLAGCAAPATTQDPTPEPPAALAEADRTSTGGGEPRSGGYWLIWNSCAPDNQADVAEANGGREAGWIIVDDLLQDPGILLGNLTITTCVQAMNLLERKDLSADAREGDPAYQLAAQLLAAQLNMASGSESCRAAEEAVQSAQLLLLGLAFAADGPYLDAPGAPARNSAESLTTTLADYNIGNLCRP